MALNFPFEMFLQAQQAQNENQRRMYQNIAGIGEGLGQMGMAAGSIAKTNQLKQVISRMLAPQGPPTAGVGGAQTATSPSEAPAIDPRLRPIMEMLRADPSMIPGALPALARGLFRGTKPAVQTVPVAFGPSGLRANDTNVLNQQEVGGEIPYKDYVTKMMSQAQRKEGQDKFDATMTQKTNQTLLPFKGAEDTLDELEKLYRNIYTAKEGGPAKGRIGSLVAGATGGKFSNALFKYQRTKAEKMHTLSTSLGVNRFNLQAMKGISDALASGTENNVQDGLGLINSLRESVRQRREKALSDLQIQGMIMRGTLGLGGQRQLPTPGPVPGSGEDDPNSLSQYEE